MKKLKDIGAVDDSLSETSWKNKKTFLQYLEQNVCVSEDVNGSTVQRFERFDGFGTIFLRGKILGGRSRQSLGWGPR